MFKNYLMHHNYSYKQNVHQFKYKTRDQNSTLNIVKKKTVRLNNTEDIDYV